MTSVLPRRSPELAALLAEGVEAGAFPGASAALGRLGEHGAAVLAASAGVLAPGERDVAPTTPYDLASLTKPFVAALALRLVQRGRVDLHEPVEDILPELAGTAGGESTLAALLGHRGGLLAWRPLHERLAHPLGSAEARRAIVRAAAQARDPERRRPGQSVYSDLGYIVAGEALARAAGMELDAALRLEVTGPLAIDDEVRYAASLDARSRETLRAEVAPTEHCPLRQVLVRGEVHDDNAHAMGGVAGHAGLFGSAAAVCAFGLSMLGALEGRSRWLDRGLVAWALRARDGGHLIGWDVPSREGSSAGASFSSQAFGHLGFTGTSIWCDPPRRLCVVLLSNRVHPTRDNVLIRAYRPRFHDAASALVEQGIFKAP